MDHFEDLKDLKQKFVSGNFHFPDSFTIGDDIEYRYLRSVNHKLEDMLHKGHKAMMIYNVRPAPEHMEKAKEAGLNSWIVLLWGFDPKYRMLPYEARTITRSRETIATRPESVAEDYKEVQQDRIIPDKVKVMILDLPVASELIGKVDTGADVCSLHAVNIEVNRGTGKVSFDCPPLSENRISVPLVDQQAVQTPSDQGTVYRPVIALNLKIAEKSLNDVRVNLNDRTNMEQPFLVGQNALEAGKFIIDPNIIKEDVNDDDFIDALVEKFSADKVEVADEKIITEEQITQMYDLFEGSNITFGDLIKILRTESLNRLKDLDY